MRTPKAPSFVTVKLGIQSRKEPQGAQVKQISSECVTYFGWLPSKINAKVFTRKGEVGICTYLYMYVSVSHLLACARVLKEVFLHQYQCWRPLTN